ncbi:MAG: radical SAM family heme chaperone HemW [Phycisphaerales bacterium]|nr:radical SAM family heme chaperone HemW [Phycisphaerales bacterium]
MGTPGESVRLSLPQRDPGGALGGDAGVILAAAGCDRTEPAQRPRALYIHTPFCVHKCHYCDFYSFVDTRDQQVAFVDRLIAELRALAAHAGTLESIFVGGGTPSLLRIDLWQRLLGEINGLFDLSMIRQPWIAEHDDPWREVTRGEFTVECNPESASPELMAVLRAGGVNRVSIGAQSFVDAHLKTLERWHNPENVAKAVEAARRAGIARQSIDLIFAIPGQTLEEWDADLRIALGLGLTHLSCYALTFEPNTAMTARLRAGTVRACDEELEAEMFRHTLATIRSAGMERYEVSNFALPGHESRHNIAYWVQKPWLAAGPSASGHVHEPRGSATTPMGTYRFKNVPRLGTYLESDPARGFSPVIDVESPDALRFIRERVMMGLRLQHGLEIAELLNDLELMSPPSRKRLQVVAERARDRGHLEMTPARWALTDAGFLLCDAITAEMIAGVRV